MGKWKSILPILLAICLALVGSLLTYRWVMRQVATAPTGEDQGEETASIVVARADLPWGTRLTLVELKMVPFLKSSLPPGVFLDLPELEGRVVLFPLKENEPILESKLAPMSVTTGGVSAIVKPGKRALAGKGDKVIGISGFIQPGNHVDVFVTLNDPRSDKEVTKLVLQDIPVLATGEKIEVNADGKAQPVDVYTLEVTPEEGEKLALATNEGKLQFALRNAMDVDTVLTKGATASEALDSFRSSVPKPVQR